MDFNYYLPVNLIFGNKKVDEVGKITLKYGKKAFLVTGKSSSKKTGLLDRIIEKLRESGIDSVIFDKVEQNPLTTTAIIGAEFAKEEKCDVIVGVGGGSIMDCAKAIAFLTCNEGDINEYIYGRKSSDKALPIILIPTTCGTGSEGNGFAVLTNPDNNDKKSLRTNSIIAKASIVDPECMMTMPKHILASVGFDALTHNMEAYLSKIGQPITDMMSTYAMSLIGKYFERVYKDNTDLEAWEAMCLASTLGGMVINLAGVTLPHGMEHPASGLRNLVHGNGLAALTPVVYEASIDSAPDKFAEISRRLGGRDEYDCVDRIQKLLQTINLKVKLSELGMVGNDIEWMAENCMKVSAAAIANHPKLFTRSGIEELYYKAL
ncbi:MAG: iron-containing alcohol dehydrogenase [Mobilitalea sp.]